MRKNVNLASAYFGKFEKSKKPCFAFISAHKNAIKKRMAASCRSHQDADFLFIIALRNIFVWRDMSKTKQENPTPGRRKSS